MFHPIFNKMSRSLFYNTNPSKTYKKISSILLEISWGQAAKQTEVKTWWCWWWWWQWQWRWQCSVWFWRPCSILAAKMKINKYCMLWAMRACSRASLTIAGTSLQALGAYKPRCLMNNGGIWVRNWLDKDSFFWASKIQNFLELHSAKFAIWTPSSRPCDNDNNDDDDNDDDDSDGDDDQIMIIIKQLNISNASTCRRGSLMFANPNYMYIFIPCIIQN